MEFGSWVGVINRWSRGNMLETWVFIVRYCHNALKCALVKHIEFYHMKSTIGCKILENHLGGHVFQEGMQIVTENPARWQMQEQPHLRLGGGDNMLNQIPSGIWESLRPKMTEAAFNPSHWLSYRFSQGSGSTILTPLGMYLRTW